MTGPFPPQQPYYPPPQQQTRKTPAALWAVFAVVAVAIVAGTIVLIALGGGGDGSGGPSNGLGAPSGVPTPGGGGQGAAASAKRAPGSGLDPAVLRLGTCFIPGKTDRALIGKLASCSDPNATFQVTAIAKKFDGCPDQGTRVTTGVHDANFKTIRYVCISVHWIVGHCYRIPNDGNPVFRVSKCRQVDVSKPVSVKPGTRATCPSPQEPWPNAFTRTTTCVTRLNS